MRLPRVVASALLVSSGLALGACGGSGSADRDAPSGNREQAVVIRSKFGVAEIDAVPKRVVAMTFTDADLALQVGVVPVGMQRVRTNPSGQEPWQETEIERLGGRTPKLFDTSSGDPLETVAALRPDLILATKDYNLDAATWKKLSAIAPVVGFERAPNEGAWEEDAVRAGRALGREARARAAVSATRADVRRIRERSPQLRGRTYSLAVQATGATFFTVNATTDVSARFLKSLGVELTARVKDLPTGSIPGRAEVAAERAGVMDADLLLATGTEQGVREYRASPLISRLPAARAGRFFALTPPTAQSMAFPSAMSLRWAMRTFVPRLEAAARR